MIPKETLSQGIGRHKWHRLIFCGLATLLWLNIPLNAPAQTKYDIVLFTEKGGNLNPRQYHYIAMLNDEIVSLMARKGIPLVKMVDMPKGHRSFIKDHAVRFYIKITLTFTHAGVGMQFKFFNTGWRENSTTFKETLGGQYSKGFAAKNLDLDLTILKREFTARIIPTIFFFMSKDKGERLLASCIWPDIDDDALNQSSREVTIHYHEHLQTLNPDNKYLIKGIDRTEFTHYCLGTEPMELPLKGAYDHIVYGYLTGKGSIDLYWEGSKNLYQNRKETSLQASTDSEIAREIAQKVFEIAPIQ
jgi:hypothetical protein